MKKGFLEQTWQKVVGSIVALILVGAASFVGAYLKATADKVYRNETDIVVVQKDVQSIGGTLGSTKADMVINQKEVENLKIQIIRLETIVERLERVTK